MRQSVQKDSSVRVSCRMRESLICSVKKETTKPLNKAVNEALEKFMADADHNKVTDIAFVNFLRNKYALDKVNSWGFNSPDTPTRPVQLRIKRILYERYTMSGFILNRCINRLTERYIHNQSW